MDPDVKYKESMTRVINIAKDLYRYPGGRYIVDGPFSGELFRNTLLVPALKENDKVIVEMDGTVGYAASFLEESFGGAVHELGLETVRTRLELRITEDDNLPFAVKDFMEKASGAGSSH